VAVVSGGRTIGTVEIVSEPRDEIAEVWENSIALAAVAAVTVLMMVGVLYLVLGRVLDPLTALATGLRGLERRDYKVRLARPKVHEFAAIVDRFNALAGALDDARAENIALNRRMITAQDDERRRTALELHDEVGPSLFGLKANVASIAKVARGLPGPPPRRWRGARAISPRSSITCRASTAACSTAACSTACGRWPSAICRCMKLSPSLCAIGRGSTPYRLCAQCRNARPKLRRHGGPDTLSLRAGKPDQRDSPCECEVDRGEGGGLRRCALWVGSAARATPSNVRRRRSLCRFAIRVFTPVFDGLWRASR
jgi:hypothetical protein